VDINNDDEFEDENPLPEPQHLVGRDSAKCDKKGRKMKDVGGGGGQGWRGYVPNFTSLTKYNTRDFG